MLECHERLLSQPNSPVSLFVWQGTHLSLSEPIPVKQLEATKQALLSARRRYDVIEGLEVPVVSLKLAERLGKGKFGEVRARCTMDAGRIEMNHSFDMVLWRVPLLNIFLELYAPRIRWRGQTEPWYGHTSQRLLPPILVMYMQYLNAL